MCSLQNIKAGDVIGFSGRYWRSDMINLGTFGIPRWGLSHVGIIGPSNRNGELAMFEAVDGVGVRSRDVNLAVSKYRGRVWLYRLSRQLYLHEYMRMCRSLSDMLGLPYDNRGAMRAAGRLLALIRSMFFGEDLTSLFCSELAAEQLSNIGIFQTSNSSRWSPNALMRTLRRAGIVCQPERLR